MYCDQRQIGFWVVLILTAYCGIDHFRCGPISSTNKSDVELHWRDLDFISQKRISKIKVSIDADISRSWDKGEVVRLPQTFEFEVDKKFYWYIERTIFRVQKIAVDDKSQTYIGPNQKFGKVAISSSKGNDVVLAITNAGFVLGDNEPTENNVFFSWGLAKLIELHTPEKFHQHNLMVLSGEIFPATDKKLFKQIFESEGKKQQ